MEEMGRLGLLIRARTPLGRWEWRRSGVEFVLVCRGLFELFVVARFARIFALIQQWTEQGVLILSRRGPSMTLSRGSGAFSVLSLVLSLIHI